VRHSVGWTDPHVVRARQHHAKVERNTYNQNEHREADVDRPREEASHELLAIHRDTAHMNRPTNEVGECTLIPWRR
jgi:hypothetical protein